MSLDNNFVSVIIATHNRPQLLTTTLNSVAKQTYRPLEVVIVDDGSDKATADALEEWKLRTNPDFNVVYLWQENQGPATARNRGVNVCRGDRILFLDDDDVFCPDAIMHLARALQDKSVAIAAASYQYWANGNPTGEVVHPRRHGSADVLRSMIQGTWFVPIHGYLFTRQALQKIGAWNPVLSSQEDDEFLLRAALADIPFIPAPQAKVYYCQHDGVRRATPGKPGETLQQGLIKRMYADLTIRESVFEALEERGILEKYEMAFLLWQMRLRKRYSSVMHRLAEISTRSILLDWLDATQNSSSENTPTSPPEGSIL